MSMDKSIHNALKEANQQIDKLLRERDAQAALVAQLREQVADYDALIERLTKAFAKLKAGHELLQRGGAWGEVKKYSGRARRPPGSTVSAGRPENGSRPHPVG